MSEGRTGPSYREASLLKMKRPIGSKVPSCEIVTYDSDITVNFRFYNGSVNSGSV